MLWDIKYTVNKHIYGKYIRIVYTFNHRLNSEIAFYKSILFPIRQAPFYSVFLSDGKNMVVEHKNTQNYKNYQIKTRHVNNRT